MPHQPGHDPAQEKVVVCGAAAKQHASGAVAAIEILSTPWPGGGHVTILDAICHVDPTFAGRLGPAETVFCDAGEVVEEIVDAGLDLLLADIRGGEGE